MHHLNYLKLISMANGIILINVNVANHIISSNLVIHIPMKSCLYILNYLLINFTYSIIDF
jgi:hypothetical protein